LTGVGGGADPAGRRYLPGGARLGSVRVELATADLADDRTEAGGWWRGNGNPRGLTTDIRCVATPDGLWEADLNQPCIPGRSGKVWHSRF